MDQIISVKAANSNA